MIDQASSAQSRAGQLITLGQLSMRSERVGATHTICLAGELDLATSGDLERELRRVQASDTRRILVDLSSLTFIDATGVRVLVSVCARARARARAEDIRLMVRRPSESVLRTLHLCGVEALLGSRGHGSQVAARGRRS